MECWIMIHWNLKIKLRYLWSWYVFFIRDIWDKPKFHIFLQISSFFVQFLEFKIYNFLRILLLKMWESLINNFKFISHNLRHLHGTCNQPVSIIYRTFHETFSPYASHLQTIREKTTLLFKIDTNKLFAGLFSTNSNMIYDFLKDVY